MPKIFISRDLNATSPFKKELADLGMEIIGQSLIRFSPTPFPAIPVVDWIFFYSKNGVKFFLEANTNKELLKHKQVVKWAAMGQGTAEALIGYGIQPDFTGNGQPKATAKVFKKVANGEKVLFPRAKISKQSIQNLLAKALTIFDLVTYKNEPKPNFHIPFCDILVFTSPLNATTYFHKYSFNPKQKIVAIGKTTQQTLQKLGLKNIIVADKPSEQALVATVTQALLKIENPPARSIRAGYKLKTRPPEAFGQVEN